MTTSPATTRRTTPKKPKPIDPSDFDAIRASKKRKSVRFDWTAYGETWAVKRPNVAVAAQLEELDSIGSFINYILAHIDADQREAFLAKLAADEDLDFDVLGDMTDSLQKVVYADLPSDPSSR